MDWAVNEFSVSGTPVLQVFDTWLRITQNLDVDGAANANIKGSSSTTSVGQNVVSNLIAIDGAVIRDSFTAVGADVYNLALWTTPQTKEASFNFGTPKKMEPIV